MRPDKFAKLVDSYFAECKATLATANKEYASDEDKLENFKVVASLLKMRPNLRNITPEDVAWVFRLKHLISLLKGISIREGMRGRRVDDIDYALLIAACVEEQEEQNEIEDNIERLKSYSNDEWDDNCAGCADDDCGRCWPQTTWDMPTYTVNDGMGDLKKATVEVAPSGQGVTGVDPQTYNLCINGEWAVYVRNRYGDLIKRQ